MKTKSHFLKMKAEQASIVMLTAYDYPTAKLAEAAGVDMILVGDSLGMVVLGYESTIPVTIEDMIHHTNAVKRGAKDTFIVCDMPFMSYHASKEDTMKNAAKMMQQSGADALKVEGAGDVIKTIELLSAAGVPIVAHLGLTPQSVGVLGGYKVQGNDAKAARQLLQDAINCEEAGAIAVVLECVPFQVAQEVTEKVSIPTIGIGAGPHTDGQVLVYHDVVGYGVNRVPKFVKQYAEVDELILPAISQYVSEVKQKAFPEMKHSFTMKEDELQQLYGGTKE
ncbi:3-methyl-2-oxobutanoate hydroxymethyltransferase [Metabacillus arenae]|uniref:3-methyl-2-oxobutanoate hydroxymethyltransferase n=1 Tax=Metabacillus arenae TaxID=2771434 RepID=A0A926RY48_9BACI|nr:3-methyl-2-oxobutanoate hydroxymethyltransferase [Metabacillus arenae]MBD1381676.1 3-methyl-2-oxobutanoate hydroxymethyltransferase [Metabacillus arenae]